MSVDEAQGKSKLKLRNSTGKRKYHQKSRKGCLTCKRRRVKCDETRPRCNKCAALKLECGYLVDEDEPAPKRVKIKDEALSPPSSEAGPAVEAPLNPVPQQATPALSPKLPEVKLPIMANTNPVSSLLSSLGTENTSNILGGNMGSISNLLGAGNLNNLNISHLVNNLGGLAEGLGGQLNLALLALLAQLPAEENFGLSSNPSSSFNPAAMMAAAAALSAEVLNAEAAANAAAAEAPQVQPSPTGLNMLDLKLMFHYTLKVANTITGAGISDTNIWNHDIPMLAFEFPFLMHSLLAFLATHLSRTESGLVQAVTSHRGDALRLLREEVLNINAANTDALVALALILIMDSLANALYPESTLPKSLPALAWIFHVKGAATILTAVWPLTEQLRFYKFISVDLGDLGDIMNNKVNLGGKHQQFSDLECHDAEIADLFPVPIDSPYLVTLAYLSKLHKERYKLDFILRIFAFPALLDKLFLSLLMTGDIKSMRIMRLYYKLLRSFTTEMKDKVWFLEGVSQVLPVDVEEYAGGAGGMHMMLDFLGGGPLIVENEIDAEMGQLDPATLSKLIDTNNLPLDITTGIMGELELLDDLD